jgi:membrane protein involved in colicin uptake
MARTDAQVDRDAAAAKAAADKAVADKAAAAKAAKDAADAAAKAVPQTRPNAVFNYRSNG